MERLRLHLLSEQEPEALSVRGIGRDVSTEDGTTWSLLSQSFTCNQRESQLRHFHACDTHCDRRRDSLEVPSEWGQKRH